MNVVATLLASTWRIPVLNRIASHLAIDYFATRTAPRPRAFSLWSSSPKSDDPNEQAAISDYTSWPSLTDKTFSGRHLCPADAGYTSSLPFDAPYNYEPPNAGQVTALFERKGDLLPSRSSLLFMFFAQWFTDSLLRTHPVDRRKNTSNHDIDLCQIYGLNEATTRLLRSGEGGRLQSQKINGVEYLDYLHEPDGLTGLKIKQRYRNLPYINNIDTIMSGFPFVRRERMYATGLERGNSSIGYVAISTVFMREHNRICVHLAQLNSDWDDERLFQTARMINILLLLRLIVEDYINHIIGYKLFRLDVSFAENKKWYRPNWMSIEFDLLYRWHGLVPDVIRAGETEYRPEQYRHNNALFEQLGVAGVVTAASSQTAGLIGLFNTPKFLLGAEYQSIKMSRDFRLRSYNDYRVAFRLDRLTEFSQLTTDSGVQQRLRELYGDVDRVEFVVGLFAENRDRDELFGSLLNRMVAYDAFTQIFTHPLLSRNIFHADTLTEYGVDLIARTNTVQDLVERNVETHDHVSASFSFGAARRGPRRGDEAKS